MMLLKKIRHLNNLKNDLINNISEVKILRAEVGNLKSKIKKQEEDLDFLKKRNILLENNNNNVIKDFALLAGSVTAIYNFLNEEFSSVEKENNKKKITYH